MQDTSTVANYVIFEQRDEDTLIWDPPILDTMHPALQHRVQAKSVCIHSTVELAKHCVHVTKMSKSTKTAKALETSSNELPLDSCDTIMEVYIYTS